MKKLSPASHPTQQQTYFTTPFLLKSITQFLFSTSKTWHQLFSIAYWSVWPTAITTKIRYLVLDVMQQSAVGQSFKWKTLPGSTSHTTTNLLCQIRTHFNYLPWKCAKVKNSGIVIIYLPFVTILQSFDLIGWEHKIFS